MNVGNRVVGTKAGRDEELRVESIAYMYEIVKEQI